MSIVKKLPVIASTSLLCLVLLVSALGREKSDETTRQVSKLSAATADEVKNDSGEMRGVWLTYIDLSMEKESDKSEAAFRKKFEKMADDCADFGANTLIVQVRPFCDALYKSSLFPYSHILTGVQGKSPGYDALKIMCETAKKKGLGLHAWINPYRIKVSSTPSNLSADNIYNTSRERTIETEGGIYLDPSKAENRELIVDGARELARNYDIDGIQFDDYFYPPDIGSADKEEYLAYSKGFGGTPMSLDNWRLANVNMLVYQVYKAVHEEKSDIAFGISPQGNINNNSEIYADVKIWSVCRGFVDYICPQIYFSLDNPRLRFEDALDDWLKLDYHESVSLYVGLAGYKAGSDSDVGTWLDRSDILAKEYEILRSQKKVKGFMLYSYASIKDSVCEKEIANLKKLLVQTNSPSQ